MRRGEAVVESAGDLNDWAGEGCAADGRGFEPEGVGCCEWGWTRGLAGGCGCC